METKTLKLEFASYTQIWTIEASDWQKNNAHRIYFRLRLQGERFGEPRQAIWDVNKQEWMPARMDVSKSLGDHLIRLYNLLPEPEPTPPAVEPIAEPEVSQSVEASKDAPTPTVSSAWTLKAFEGYYEARNEEGKIVRCNQDDFASIAAECEQAGIELTPERALAEGWPGFYEVTPGWGGKREGAGRPADSAKAETREPAYQKGYQAGYKAGERKQATKLVKKTEQVWKKYQGDTCVAIVVDGKCVRGWMNAQTYGTISTHDGRNWWWVGQDVETLKENHFSYSHTNERFFGAKSGREYFTDGDEWWAEWEEDGELYQGKSVREVEITEQ